MPDDARATAELEDLVADAAATLARRGDDPLAVVDAHQPEAYTLAFLAAEAAALRAVVEAAAEDRAAGATAFLAVVELLRSARARLDGMRQRLGVRRGALNSDPVRFTVGAVADPGLVEDVLAEADHPTTFPSEELGLAAAAFRRFGEEVIAPVAQEVHREDRDVPEEVISGLAAMGAFGLSIPAEYGGSQDPAAPDHLAMVVATEELSRASLGVGGSLITRPEILARALVTGGTEEQKRRWLPAIASGEQQVAVAVTEPDAGSDLAALRTAADPHGGGYCLNGTKTWSTFAGRAELLMVLARTAPSGHRGLSLFVVEKDRAAGHEFSLRQSGGGRMSGRAIPTIGYRGMHSFEVTFDGWQVPADSVVGGDAGLGRGFYLQLDAFAAGRLQTAARAVGVMQAAFAAGRDHAAARRVFGRPLAEYGLTRQRLAAMAAQIAAQRLFAYSVAERLAEPEGQLEAAMVKALACRAAEAITRDALQMHGGYGYAEEYPVSRYFVDARVLSIFEGAEEVLALRVIARRLIEQASREVHHG